MNNDEYRTRRPSASTAAEVLQCDVCRSRIDDLDDAMLFWRFGVGVEVADVIVSHKRHDPAGSCCELTCFAHEPKALHRLAAMMGDARWTAQQAQRLIDVAWAVSKEATAEQRQRCRDSMLF